MPLVYQQNINESTKLAVWHIAEKEEFFLETVTLQKEITHPHKRLQHLAGRYLLTELFPDFPLELIKIADTKKPFLPDEKYHFSISHCGDYAAVIVSPKNRVGVDIEIVSEKVERIMDKFLSGAEQFLIKEIFDSEYSIVKSKLITLAWSIKETMFKWHGSGGMDFNKHLHIDSIQINTNEFTAHCTFSKNTSLQLVVHGLLIGENVLTWVCT